jgi:DNA polymerase III gamma/tau subunit
VAQIAEHAPTFVSTLDELSSILHQMTIAQMVPDALDTSWPDQARIVELAARATVDDTQLFWQMAVAGRRDVHLASSARAGAGDDSAAYDCVPARGGYSATAAMAGETPAKKPEPPAISLAPVEAVNRRAAINSLMKAIKRHCHSMRAFDGEIIPATDCGD